MEVRPQMENCLQVLLERRAERSGAFGGHMVQTYFHRTREMLVHDGKVWSGASVFGFHCSVTKSPQTF